MISFTMVVRNIFVHRPTTGSFGYLQADGSAAGAIFSSS
jgi:hypothetical protein